MILQSLSGLPAFLAYLMLAAALVAAYLLVYTSITQHNEFALIRNDVPGAAMALGASAIGFALPLTSAISHSANVIDCLIWGLIALIVQRVVGLRPTIEAEVEGLDLSEHGEEGYIFDAKS